MADFIKIKITGGYTLISPEDAELVKGYNWCVDSDGYAVSFNPPLKMHHLIIGNPPAGMVNDHKNRVRLDNRRENLRHATHKVNRHNRGLQIPDEQTPFLQDELVVPSSYDRKAVNYARNGLGRFVSGKRKVLE
jgi:hypothetical protein